ncbi:hypothetical protein DSO57_1005287 [Entomophthora muscae]|uniref:Uncharacterized protein n=2 Tax=Entomophthora muscae TaxID=34485 RepID=A0ACC2SIF4_9FUNG|nr:hypothetical protein DSO57_1014007 [Entomophthora muscae]KAJ9074546.1 hypothetical protein DSO57_1005287 [Entomophthora muscae]
MKMKLFVSLVVLGASLQASLVDEINRERISSGVPPVDTNPRLSTLLKEILAAQKTPGKTNPSDTIPEAYGGAACDAFLGSQDCFKLPASEFLYRNTLVVLAAPSQGNSSEGTIGNMHGSFGLSGNGNFTDAVFKSAGEYVEGDLIYVVLSAF